MHALFNISVEGRSFQRSCEIEFTPMPGMQVCTAFTRTFIDLVSYDLDGGWWYVALRLDTTDTSNTLFLDRFQKHEWEELGD